MSRSLPLAVPSSAGVRHQRLQPALRLALYALLLGVTLAFSSAGDDDGNQPSQTPLFTNLQGSPPPHLMITVDDSRSMASPLMTNPLRVPDGHGGLAALRVDPLAADTAGVYVLHPALVPPGAFYPGVLAANPYSDNVAQMAARSGDVNALYYNPDLRYVPWSGLGHAEADIHQLEVPTVSGLSVTLDLSRSFEATRGMWCLPTQNRWIDPGAGPYAGQYLFIDARLKSSAAQTPCWLISQSAPTGGLYWTVSEPLNPTSGSTSHSLDLFIDGWPGATAPDEATLTRLARPGGGLPFHPGLYYRLRRDPLTGHLLDGRVPQHYERYDVNDPARFNAGAKTSARTDCMAARCTQAEEQRNFANWFRYHHTRLLTARGAMGFAVTQLPDGLQLGWGGLNQKDVVHTPVRALQPDHRSAALHWIYNLWPTDGATPMLKAANAIGQYFRRTDPGGPWGDTSGVAAQDREACRRSYHLMVTDGLRTDAPGPGAPGDVDADGHPSTLADFVARDWATDLRPDLPDAIPATPGNPATWQHLVQMLVGFGDTGSDARALTPVMGATGSPHLRDATGAPVPWAAHGNEDLLHAAVNSRGRYFSVHRPGDLGSALAAALATTSSGTSQHATAGAVASSRGLAGNRLYISSFEATRWSGDIVAHTLDAAGKASAADSPVWRAEDRLPRASSRHIVTWDGERERMFTTEGLAAGPLADGQTPDLLSQIGALDGVSTRTLIDFVRGDRSAEIPTGPLRARAARRDADPARPVLGDFVNSQPLFVRGGLDMGYSRLPAAQGGHAYVQFLAAKATRPGLVLAGASDGMLHALLDTLGATPHRDGEEVLAYVPQAVLGDLLELARPDYGSPTRPHRFLVDGRLREADAWLPASPGSRDGTPQWRNLVLGSLGAGGRAVFALDTTELAQQSLTSGGGVPAGTVRWEINGHDSLGHVLAAAETGVLPDGTWVAVFGNGPGSPDGHATLFVVGLDDGQVQTVHAGSDTGNGLGGVTVVRNSVGQITSVYAGDLKGTLWRFDWRQAGPMAAARAADAADGTVVGRLPALTGLPVSALLREWVLGLLQSLENLLGVFTPLASMTALPATPARQDGLPAPVTEREGAAAAKAGFVRASEHGLARLTSPDGQPQAITQAPAVVSHPQGGRMVVVGTGRLFSHADPYSRQVESVYGLWDRQAGVSTGTQPLNRTTLAERSLSLQGPAGTSSSPGTVFIELTGQAIDWNQSDGWVMDLTALSQSGTDTLRPAERVVLPVVAESSLDIRVDTTRPPAGASSPCQPIASDGAVYRIRAITGLSSSHMYDTNGDGFVSDLDADVGGYQVTHGSGVISVSLSPGDSPPDEVASAAGVGGSASTCPQGTVARRDVGVGAAVLTCVAATTEQRTVRDRVWRRLAQAPF